MKTRGFSLIELVIAMAAAALLLGAMQRLMVESAALRDDAVREAEAATQLRYAFERMLRHAAQTQHLLVPTGDVPETALLENVREGGVGIGGTALFAMSLPATVDIDGDGIADADNDGDGRVNEDTGEDLTNDGMPGIAGLDDDGDGVVDNGGSNAKFNDDERAVPDATNEDPIDGVDNDGDGSVDEDWGADQNGDGEPGIAGLDDDGDGSVDEGNFGDDDEDGSHSEDWLDPLVYFLDGDVLIERMPVPWDANGDNTIDGRDYVESTLLDGVSRFRIERVAKASTGAQLIDLLLETTSSSGEVLSLHARIRVGDRL